MLVYSNRRIDEKTISPSLNLIGRYIFREVLTSTALVVAVLLIIFMSNQFAETLGDAAADLLPRGAVLRVFGLQFVQYLAVLAPIGVLLGVLLAMARLNRDSEMTALAACGIGPARLLIPIGALGVLVAAGVGWLALDRGPAASREIESIRFEAQSRMELGVLTPGRFNSVDAGGTVLYAAGSRDDVLLDIFIEREEDGRSVVILAEEGQRTTNPATGDSMLRLRNGKRYVGEPGDARAWIEEFEVHGIPVRIEESEFVEAIEARSTASLLSSADPESRAELAWRISIPVSVLALALLAVPLGRSSPREGKYARFGAGLLIYIIYANLLSIARVWIERETVPVWLNIWWVHAALLLLAVAMLVRQSGVGRGQPTTSGARVEPAG